MASSSSAVVQPPNKKARKTLTLTPTPIPTPTPNPAIFNYLSEDIVEKIFSFLPFKKVCSLAILSRRFANSWRLCRNLCFDSDFASRLTRDECRTIVHRFFMNRLTLRADRFRLSYDANNERILISSWIYEAVFNLRVEELELDLSPTILEAPGLDYSLVDVPTLKILRLVKCELHLPIDSQGLRYVQEITLQNVRADPLLVKSIFANCKSLRVMRLIRCTKVGVLIVSAKNLKWLHTLEVRNCLYIQAMGIQAPTLRKFHYNGKFVDMRFVDKMPELTDVVLDLAYPRALQNLSDRPELVERFANVEFLTVTSIFLEGLCVKYDDNDCTIMHFSLPKLKEIHLIVSPASSLDPLDVVVFVQNCPLIEKVFIDLGRNTFINNPLWEKHGRNYLEASKAVFPFLKFLKIKGFTARELPMYMVRFFLTHADNLESLVLVKARIKDCFPPNYSEESIRSWGVMSLAKIEVYNYREDKKTLLPHYLRVA